MAVVERACPVAEKAYFTKTRRVRQPRSLDFNCYRITYCLIRLGEINSRVTVSNTISFLWPEPEPDRRELRKYMKQADRYTNGGIFSQGIGIHKLH